jgi:hypothetical protein
VRHGHARTAEVEIVKGHRCSIQKTAAFPSGRVRHPVWVECVLLSFSVPGRDFRVGACPHNNRR